MPIIIPANSAAGGGGYEVTNSARFNPASNDRLTRTPSSDGSRVKWTWSCWAKRGTDNQDLYLFGAYQNSSYNTFLKFASGGEIRFADVYGGSEQARINTLAKFRDPSAWYHIVVVYDKDNSTSTDRLIMYVNGVRITEFDGSTMSSQSTTFNTANIQVQIGALNGDGDMNGYMSEICFVNNQALAPTSFGEFDEDSGIWKPIESVADLTFGTNGFYMDFKDSSELGNDAAGSNNYAEVNMTALNQTTDTCTNNFATLNPIDNGYGSITFTEGNLKGDGASSGWQPARGTIGLSSGKWYWEVNMSGSGQIGVSNTILDMDNDNSQDLAGVTVFYNAGGGYIRTDGSQVGGTVGTGDMNTVFGYALDMDNKKLSLYKTNSIIVTNTALSTSITDFALPFFCVNGGGQYRVNFGNPSVALDNAGVADGNGYGSFEYAPPTGYLAICTKNLSETDS